MKPQKSAILEELRLGAADEPRAVAFLEDRRWGSAPTCPRCGGHEVYRMTDREGKRSNGYRWRCHGCKKMHSVRTGTVLEGSRLPVRVWVYGLWSACSSKNGIAALQLSREVGITHKSALFMLHRIRLATGTDGTQQAPTSGNLGGR